MYIPHVPPYRTLLPILPYTILPSRLYPKSIPSYPPLTFNTPRFPSIYMLFHSTLSYSSVPYPKLLHPTPTETRPKYHKIIMDIQKFLDIQKCILGYSQIDFWISIIHFWISKNTLKYIFGYPKVMLNFGYP